ncbi:MAG: hypothetical protein AAGE52_38870 [Myxococcota bacterium]
MEIRYTISPDLFADYSWTQLERTVGASVRRLRAFLALVFVAGVGVSVWGALQLGWCVSVVGAGLATLTATGLSFLSERRTRRRFALVEPIDQHLKFVPDGVQDRKQDGQVVLHPWTTFLGVEHGTRWIALRLDETEALVVPITVAEEYNLLQLAEIAALPTL